MLGAVHMVKEVIVINMIHKLSLILRRLELYFSYPKNQYLTEVLLIFKDVLKFWAQGYK